jgi:phosphoglycerol transferase MdoB-like AlkP superfamily enzyme
MKIFILGAVNDFSFALLALLPFYVLYLGFSERKYDRPYGFIIELLLIAAVIYTYFLPSIFNEYGGGAPKIAKAFFTYKLISFSLRLFIPKIRDAWRKIEFHLVIFIYILCLLFNAVGEYFFWNEFGVRYNFIAVDYLVYTNEVIGNIFESYPVIPMTALLLAVAALIQWLLVRHRGFRLNGLWHIRKMTVSTIVYAVLLFISSVLLHVNHRYTGDNDVFATELQSNGCYDFYLAFRSNTLKYSQFYTMLTERQCKMGLSKLCNNSDRNNLQRIQISKPELRKNIILITVESLSADFLKAYGNTDDITPNLDTLMNKSLVFDNLYAVGNRTVRGLEALSLCVPPSAGESLIKRPGNKNLPTIGRLLHSKGYVARFIYGGDSYFDNMGEYFSNNGYKVTDEKDFTKSEITFSNIWGTCDEDSYRKALKVFDGDAKAGKPFFADIMTISNHRPYTYPAGKIKLSGDPKSRQGGVKYTDYAIGQFLKEARKKTWFANTVFIIIADHCASSAGSTSIPLDKYHIPAIVYSPGFIAPRHISKLCSQIDIMPTILSLLHFSYQSRFVGQDIFSPSFRQRAFMATYQDLGYYQDNILTVLSPVRNIVQYNVRKLSDGTFSEQPAAHRLPSLVNNAICFYQWTNMYFMNNRSEEKGFKPLHHL